ncbi:MAG: GIY-YIG nuclease family protein [Candidatus Magasanikbacteria bacterium]|nr:GIY-YIG nuclease family protein [Candidatus Magasanikbacteria bacterium]
MFTTYVIKNDIDEIYIGQTDDLFLRLKRHNGELPTKNTSYTHKHKNGEWNIVLTEEFETRRDAMKREKQLKSSRGRVYIREIITRQKLK